MADHARRKEFLFFLILTLVVNLTKSWDNPYREKLCGVLHPENNFQGEKFLLKDDDESSNLFEDHRTPSKWSETGSIQIEKGCKMEVCNDTYFDGTCKLLDAGSHISSVLANAFSGNVSSVRCNCERECKCEDIFMKKSSCARAYLKGGCKVCDSLYTDLSRDSDVEFAKEFRGKVEAFKLRKGCKLTLYPVEDSDEKVVEQAASFADQEQITDEVFENYNGTFGSYDCECEDDKYVPKPTPRRPDKFPKWVDVPDSLDDVIKMLRNDSYTRHPGLTAAFNAMKGKRSGKNAYILLLGSTGAGKSSAINLLFDNPNITKTGHAISTTTDIHEFRVSVPIDELGIANSELRVIDTPGLGDTRGLEQDAKFLATLESFLDNHEELKYRIPNVVLIFHKFNDNRFKGEGAHFVRMIRGLDNFRERITDNSFSNVIFVLSHFCSETPVNKRRPTMLLKEFKEVIEDYSLFPKPILLTVAENKAKEEWQLPALNGFYKLPNNEYYPRNLFEKMELVTKNGQDMVGMGVFRTAFRDSENVNVSAFNFQLLDRDSATVTKYLRILTNTGLGVVSTEISQILDEIWERDVPVALRKQFESSLPILKKTLNLRNINYREDIPRTTTDILLLLTAIKHDEATRMLLDKGLGIKPPVFTQNPIAGHGYNVFKDSHLATSPFNLGENQLADIGFLLPKVLTCKLDQSTTQNMMTFDDKQVYIQHRLHSLGINGELPPESFKGDVKPGHNIKAESFRNDSCSLSATREFRHFQFIINDRVPFKKEFEKDVKSLPVFDQGNHESVTKWIAFFEEYGTHVVKSVHGGGAIEIKLESEEPFNDDMREALFDVIKFAEDMSFLIEDDTTNGTRTVLKAGTSHTLKFHGGDSKYYTSDLTKMSIQEAVNLMNSWKNSLKFNPAILTTEMRLEPLSQTVVKLGRNYSAEIEKATALLFNASLKYDPNRNKEARGNPRPRDQTDFVMEAMTQMNSQIQALFLQNSKMQALADERQYNMSQQRMAWEKAEKERERIHQWNVTQVNLQARKEQEIMQQNFETKRNAAAKAAAEAQQKILAMTIQSNQVAGEQQRNLTLQIEAMQREERKLERIHQQAMAEANQKAMEANNKLLRDLEEMRIAAAKVAADAQRKLHEEQLKANEEERKRLQEILDEERNRHTCLKAETKILMADFSQKPVELLKVGDTILDKDLKPTRVLGVVYEFLGDDKFYGFDNSSFFFTSNHLLVGPSLDGALGDHQLYAKSTKSLISINPLMKFLNVSNMEDHKPLQVFYMNEKQSVSVRDVQKVSEDPQEYPLETFVYDIRVDSRTGTYFCNGYVCSHEIPPIEHWPNTMSILFPLMRTDSFQKLAHLPYTIENEEFIQAVTSKVAENVRQFLQKEDGEKVEVGNEYEIMTLGDVDLEGCFEQIFSNPSTSAVAVGLYAKVGPIVSPYLDEAPDADPNDVGKLQQDLYQIIIQELTTYVS